jgi:hypothetical protein
MILITVFVHYCGIIACVAIHTCPGVFFYMLASFYPFYLLNSANLLNFGQVRFRFTRQELVFFYKTNFAFVFIALTCSVRLRMFSSCCWVSCTNIMSANHRFQTINPSRHGRLCVQNILSDVTSCLCVELLLLLLLLLLMMMMMMTY